MEKDFAIKSGIYLVKGDYELGLHNDFNFRETRYSVLDRTASLKWVRSNGKWVGTNNPAFISLNFFEVSEFRFLPRDPELPFTEDDCLHNAGYWIDEEWCDYRGARCEVVDGF